MIEAGWKGSRSSIFHSQADLSHASYIIKLESITIALRVQNKSMVEPKPMIGQKRPSSKVFRPQELSHRFGAKADFVRYFREQCKCV